MLKSREPVDACQPESSSSESANSSPTHGERLTKGDTKVENEVASQHLSVVVSPQPIALRLLLPWFLRKFYVRRGGKRTPVMGLTAVAPAIVICSAERVVVVD